jgi:hypothetical protein
MGNTSAIHGCRTRIFANGNKYEGEWKDNKMYGRGTYIWANGDKYKGVWKDNKMYGHATIIFATGDKYEGEMNEHKAHGRGTRIWANCGKANCGKYEGLWKDGMMYGRGTYIWANDDKYEGEWKDDKKHGRGTNIWANGDKYEGEWKDNKMYGHGTYIWANGDKYEGEWKDDKKHGHGTLIYADGDKYEGGWKDDKMNGRGTYIFANGDKYEGESTDGLPSNCRWYIQSLVSRDYSKWFDTQTGKIFLQSPDCYQFINTKVGLSWLTSESGKEWLKTDNGAEWIKSAKITPEIINKLIYKKLKYLTSLYDISNSDNENDGEIETESYNKIIEKFKEELKEKNTTLTDILMILYNHNKLKETEIEKSIDIVCYFCADIRNDFIEYVIEKYSESDFFGHLLETNSIVLDVFVDSINKKKLKITSK